MTSAILESIVSNDLNKFKTLIAEDNYDNKLENGYTPLMIATLHERLDIINFLINSGCNVNETNDKGETALYLATKNNSKVMVELFLKQNADLYSEVSPPIFAAVENANYDIVKLYLEHGYNINLKNKHGHTPFMSLLKSKNTDYIEYSISKGALINVESVNEALNYNDNNEIVKLLFSHNLELKPDSKSLELVYKHKNIEMFKYFVDRGFEIDVKQLLWNCLKNDFVYLKWIEYAYKKNVDLDVKNKKGVSLSKLIVKGKFNKILNMFVEYHGLVLEISKKNPEDLQPEHSEEFLTKLSNKELIDCLKGGMSFNDILDKNGGDLTPVNTGILCDMPRCYPVKNIPTHIEGLDAAKTPLYFDSRSKLKETIKLNVLNYGIKLLKYI